MKEYENHRYEFEIKEDNGEKKIYLSVNVMNLEKEKAEKIICELEQTKRFMEEILAG